MFSLNIPGAPLSLAVIVPTYNEKENLPILVDQLLKLPTPDLHILVIDDNSPDGTGKIADELAAQMPRQISVIHRAGKLGLGTAYIQGFKHLLQTDSQYIAQMDCDFSHPPQKLVEFIQVIQSCDVVLGSRYVSGGSLDQSWPFWRKALSGFGNAYARTILGLKVRDVTGGFRLWRREVLSAIPLDDVKSNGYIFQVEMLFIANKLGFKVNEVPIYFAERKFGKSKMNLRIQVEAALRVWALRSRYHKIKRIEYK
jgi:dolichol-phosphate mannosyltransferase